MSAMLARILMQILASLLTKKFVSKMLAIGAWEASQWSENKVDDKLAESFAEALGVDPKDYK